MNAAFPPQQRAKNATAQIAAWVGIGGLLCWFGSPIALVLGLLAQRQVRAEPGRYSNEGSALVGIVLGGVGSALLVVALVIVAIGAWSPSSPPTAAASATTPSALAGPASASASASATAAAQAAPVTLPSTEDVAIDRAFFAVKDAHPGANAMKSVAAKRHTSVSKVLAALSRVAEYRDALAKEAGKSADKDIVGDIDLKTVKHTPHGDFTAIVSFTAIRCPDGQAAADEGLRTLVSEAMKQLAQNLPPGIDSFEASLWYRGMTCSRAPIGYSASWKRGSDAVDLK